MIILGKVGGYYYDMVIPDKAGGYNDDIMVLNKAGEYCDDFLIPSKDRRWLWWCFDTWQGWRMIIDMTIFMDVFSHAVQLLILMIVVDC